MVRRQALLFGRNLHRVVALTGGREGLEQAGEGIIGAIAKPTLHLWREERLPDALAFVTESMQPSLIPCVQPITTAAMMQVQGGQMGQVGGGENDAFSGTQFEARVG